MLKNSVSAMLDFWEAYERGIQKISWGTSQFVDWAACAVLNRSKMVLSGDVPSNCSLASFRHARFSTFSAKSPQSGLAAILGDDPGCPRSCRRADRLGQLAKRTFARAASSSTLRARQLSQLHFELVKINWLGEELGCTQ